MSKQETVSSQVKTGAAKSGASAGSSLATKPGLAGKGRPQPKPKTTKPEGPPTKSLSAEEEDDPLSAEDEDAESEEDDQQSGDGGVEQEEGAMSVLEENAEIPNGQDDPDGNAQSRMSPVEPSAGGARPLQRSSSMKVIRTTGMAVDRVDERRIVELIEDAKARESEREQRKELKHGRLCEFWGDSIKRGCILFTWQNGLRQSKVPYWIVPDDMMNDPLLVEKVVSAMDVVEPNLLLRFSRVKQCMQRWHNGWNFDKTGDGNVSEGEFPFKLPPGMSREHTEVAEYLCAIAQDRVRNILSGVSSACNQAGAWIELACFDEGDSPYGLVDHAGPMLGQVSDEKSIIFSTYCLEERRKWNGNDDENATIDRTDADSFVQSLIHFAGDDDAHASSNRRQPRIFKYDITKVMSELELDNTTRRKKEVLKEACRAIAKSVMTSAEKKMEAERMAEEKRLNMEKLASCKKFLPSKDLTHLLCFESKACEMRFRDLLTSRTPVGNFIIEGDVQAAKLFSNSMKHGTPVFIMKGTGGASDKISLVLDHMKWRKLLDMDGDDTTNLDDNTAAKEDEAIRVGPFSVSRDSHAGWALQGLANSVCCCCSTVSSDQAEHRSSTRVRDEVDDANQAGDAIDSSSDKLGLMIEALKLELDTAKKDREKAEEDGEFDRALEHKQKWDVINKLSERADKLNQDIKGLHEKMMHEVTVAENMQIGLKWQDVGSQEPSPGTGTDLSAINGFNIDFLAAQLRNKLEFSLEEWQSFKFPPLKGDSYIKVDDKFFQTVEILKDLNTHQFDDELLRVYSDYVDLQNEYKDQKKNSFGSTASKKRVDDGSSAGDSSTGSGAGDHVMSAMNVPFKKADNPENVYKEDIRVGREGLAWEAVHGTFESWWKANKDRCPPNTRSFELDEADSKPPDAWFLPHEADDWNCVKLKDRQTNVARPCSQQDCEFCGPVKKRERSYLRRLAKQGRKWHELGVLEQSKYIRFWRDRNMLEDDDPTNMHPDTAQLCRVIYQNVYEPPVPEAVVPIDLLEPDLNYEDVMDKVTEAMSADIFVVEVGEKTAMRRRLLIAHQFVRQLDQNISYQNFYRHLFQELIIILTFLSILSGVLSYELKTAIDKALCSGGELNELNYAKSVTAVACEADIGSACRSTGARCFGLTEAQDVLFFSLMLRWANIVLPLVNSFMIALNSLWVPGTKYQKLLFTRVAVESEIYKCRCRAGEYSQVGGGAGGATGTSAATEADAENKGSDDRKKKTYEKTTDNRKILAARLDEIWSDLGSSEIRQGMLVKPSDYDLVKLGGTFKTQEHPALYDEGKAFSSGNTQQKQDVLGRFAREYKDDGLKRLSANEYLDIRVAVKMREFEKRAPRLALANMTIKTIMLLCTSGSTFLGAFKSHNWIPVSMGIVSVFGSITAYMNLEDQLRRTNAALVSIRKLMVWWHGLSVIEKRIPQNASNLILTMEQIVITEVGRVVVQAQSQSDGSGETDESDAKQ